MLTSFGPCYMCSQSCFVVGNDNHRGIGLLHFPVPSGVNIARQYQICSQCVDRVGVVLDQSRPIAPGEPFMTIKVPTTTPDDYEMVRAFGLTQEEARGMQRRYTEELNTELKRLWDTTDPTAMATLAGMNPEGVTSVRFMRGFQQRNPKSV